MHFVTDTYEKTALPLLSSAVQKTYLGAIRKHLAPVVGDCCLRDLTPLAVQAYFSGLHVKGVHYPTIVKVRDALSSILRAAVGYEFLENNPLETCDFRLTNGGGKGNLGFLPHSSPLSLSGFPNLTRA